MKDIFNTLRSKNLQFIFLFYILLLVPVLAVFLAENYTVIDKVLLCSVCSLLFGAIFTICAFVSPRVEKIIYSIILTLAIIPGSIYLGYLLFAHVMLEQNSVMSLFETNPEESKEFLAHYMNIWVIVGVLIYAAIPIIIICKMKSIPPLKTKGNKWIIALSILIIIGIIGFERVSRSVYFINIYRSFVSYQIRVNLEIKTIKERQNLPFEVKTINDTVPQTVILIIGESLTKHHMSLYGYKRETNPFLSQYSDTNLIVYKDVTSPQVHTIPVLRSVLSMTDMDNPEYFEEKPSLIELFNRAGYETYFISNQSFSEKCHCSYDILLTLAKHKFNFAPQKQYDGIVLTALDKILEKDKDKNRFILIHLIGNHMAYEFRYPYMYNQFDYRIDKKIENKPFRNNAAKRMIDRYDNSVLYNDYIINSILQRLSKQENDNSMMIYFSDHGEELYDYREFAGHVYEKVSPTMCEIPFMVWMSQQYKKKRSNLVFDSNRPYSIEDFIFSISEISGFDYEGFDKTRSIFSSDFKPRKRYIGEKDYDDIKDKFSEQ